MKQAWQHNKEIPVSQSINQSVSKMKDKRKQKMSYSVMSSTVQYFVYAEEAVLAGQQLRPGRTCRQ